MPIIIERLHKSFAHTKVLRGIDLTVNAGEFIGLIGANGAGKTTLIKCLLDFCRVSSGTIKIFGVTHTNSRAREKLAFLPETFLPPYYLTGNDFLVYISELYGIEYNLEKVKHLAGILDFDISVLSQSVRKFSKGMAQKLGLMACFLSDKDLFILDEPMSGLDPQARSYFKEYLLGLKQSGKTVFFSTHLLADIEVLCDRTAVLHGGLIKFIGTTGKFMQAFKGDNLEQAYLACLGKL